MSFASWRKLSPAVVRSTRSVWPKCKHNPHCLLLSEHLTLSGLGATKNNNVFCLMMVVRVLIFLVFS